MLYSVEPARPRVDQHRGRPAAAALLHRQLARERQGDQEPAEDAPSCGSSSVANPDGYQYTFDHERLWRKNLRDNNGDGQITGGDGVDPNRNFNEHWGYDNEGSSPRPERRPTAVRRRRPSRRPRRCRGCSTASSRSSSRTSTRSGRGCSTRRAGRSARPTPTTRSTSRWPAPTRNPAIPGFDPGSRRRRCTSPTARRPTTPTSHDGHDLVHAGARRGLRGCGFVFPDDEALIQAEFVKTLPFDLTLATSAAHPADPDSSVGHTTKPFYLEPDRDRPGERRAVAVRLHASTSPTATRRRCASSPSAASAPSTLNYQINGGAVQTRADAEWTGRRAVRRRGRRTTTT